MFDSSDEYDFTPTSNSKLASLFNATMYRDDIPSGSNTSLTYTAPKQPKKEIVTEKINNPKPQSSMILAKIVNLWKIDENKVKHPLGKHGIAIIGNVDQNLYECIFYREKNNILIRVKLNENFTWYTYPENFGAFYDNESIFWMAKFSQAQDEVAFLDEIVKCKCKVMTNDPPEEKKAEVDVAATKKEQTCGSNTSTKANILSRITKMGQQILPERVVKHTSTDLSDSELDETKVKKPILAPRKFKRSQNMSEKSSQLQLSVATQPSLSVQESAQNQMVLIPSPQNPNNALVYGHIMPDATIDLNRYLLHQNAEMKNNLTEITAKLDNLLGQKNTNNSGTNEKSLRSKTKVMELKIENLMSELEESKLQFTKLKEKYEKGNQKTELETELLKKLQQKELEVTEKLGQLGVQSLDDCFDLVSQNESFKIKVDQLNNTVANLQLKIKDLEESYLNKKAEGKNVELDKSRELDVVSELIKKHMNSLYQQLMENFDQDDELFSNKTIQQIIVKNIKEVTYNLLSELHEDVFKNKVLTD